MLEEILEGEKLTGQLHNNVSLFLRYFTDSMEKAARDFEPEAKISVYEDIMKMYAMIYIDGDYGFWHFTMANYCVKTAKLYLKNSGEADKALSYLEKSAAHGIGIDTLPLPTSHTSPLVSKCKIEGVSKNYKGNASSLLLRRLKDESFDSIRETKQFKTIEENLKKHARDDV